VGFAAAIADPLREMRVLKDALVERTEFAQSLEKLRRNQ
jgi:succinate dehydrogenase/fumarate reductase-like Fe-S protein